MSSNSKPKAKPKTKTETETKLKKPSEKFVASLPKPKRDPLSALEPKKVNPNQPKKGTGGSHNFPQTMSIKQSDIKRIGVPLAEQFKRANRLAEIRGTRAITDEELQQRVEDYFDETLQNGLLPTVEGLAVFLGYTKETLWKWENGEEGSTPTRRNLIKRAKQFLSAFDASYAMENKVYPATYIFRAKNYYGMKDEQEHVFAQRDPLGDRVDPEKIKERLEGGVAKSFDVEFEEIDDDDDEM